MAWYDTGTVSVTNGSTTVTGSGTNFVSGARIGEGFVGPDGRLYEIESITSATVLVLADPYLGSTQAGQDYKIVPTQSLTADLANQVTTLITDYQSVVDNAGEGKFDDGSAASPAITFVQDQDTGFFRETANEIAISVGGAKIGEFNSGGLDGTVIGAGTPSAGSFTTGQFDTSLNVDGTVTSDGLTVDSSSFVAATLERTTVGGGSALQLTNGDDNAWQVINGGDDTYSLNYVPNGGSTRPYFKISSGGDIQFYDDTGTTPKLTWDSAAESLGIGTSSVSNKLSIDVTNTNTGDPFASSSVGVIALQNTSTTANTSTAINNKNPTSDSANSYIRFINEDGGFKSSIAFGTATAGAGSFGERLRIDSSGNVGIGESSPATALDVNGTITSDGLKVNTSASDEFIFLEYEGTSTANQRLRLITGDDASTNSKVFGIEHTYQSNFNNASVNFFRGGSTSGGFLTFDTNGSEAMRIDSSGNVGIGVSSPSAALDIKTGTGNLQLGIVGSASGQIAATNTLRFSAGAATSDPIQFYTAGTEAMRLDSSGNLLVGTTSDVPWTNSAGTNDDNAIAVRNDGLLGVAAYKTTAGSGAVTYFNRTGTDGPITLFYKDGSPVGSIGTVASQLFVASGDTGLQYNGTADQIRPCDGSGAARDAAIDLGDATRRFKDLYLSGGVYLGGTGAANKLDDYETGTFTPFIYGDTTAGTGTYSTQQGYYTKIGRQVNVEIRLQLTAHTGTGGMILGGLPFTIADDINGMPLSFTAENLSIPSGSTERAYFDANTTTISLISIPTGGGGPTNITVDGTCLLTLSGFYHV